MADDFLDGEEPFDTPPRDLEAIDRSGRALGERIEAANGFDLIAEQVQTERVFLVRREQVD